MILALTIRIGLFFHSYFGEPIGRHAAGGGRIHRPAYVMPDALRYRIRADVLRPARSVYWDGCTDGSTLATEEVTEDVKEAA